jgi:hypothetical protein
MEESPAPGLHCLRIVTDRFSRLTPFLLIPMPFWVAGATRPCDLCALKKMKNKNLALKNQTP